ncbi:LysM peptidoglycan-binding domain-containing protein [Chitinophaga polysaccharea]|uniref:glucosaminidase domain-containing protein n=1 Tax=Chitinophaga TaxID=79328 RepID=UPI001455C506|nr:MULTISPECIES: glucosaminidase domain-containing protein [Chitinophaga]NLR56723.1 LysM peptidoglycan-binding domain-containing protein [Chitinophaga polysaccharea]NLU92951.1 LysM peptidoglycan-binding domain-containing protein [Chitinophaga sp. Ak27]
MQVRKFLLIVSFLIGFVTVLQAQTMTTQQYIATYKNLAIEEMRRTGVPAAIKLAQGIVETQSGNGTLCLQSNNHFGIKCKNTWTGKTIKYDDDAAQECFRVYDSAADSYRDHSDFLHSNPRYAFLFQFDGDDYKSWAFGLKQAGYATNKTYPQQLIKVIEDYNLQQYSLIAMGKMAPGAGDGFLDKTSYAEVTPKAEPRSSGSRANHNTHNKQQAGNYPKGIFEINGRKAVFVKAGTSLIRVADQYNKRLRKLVRFNDLDNDNPPARDMIVFLQKKSKRGGKEFHPVINGETMHDVAQAEGIQLRWLRRRNKMSEGEEPAAGQRLTLDGFASSAPRLAKNTRVLKEEDQEPPEDFSPRKAIEGIKEEVAKTTGVTAVPESKPAAQQPGGIPVAMVEDLKKAGQVTTSGGSATAPRATLPQTPPPPPVITKPAPAPASRGGLQYHDVQPKETLYGIAKMYNRSIAQLQEWNNLQGYDIKIGQRLLVNK